MVTLGKAAGAVRRAAAGGIVASLVLGLAACASAATGADSAARSHPVRSAEANPASARPSHVKIIPRTPTIRPSSEHVPLCMEIPKLTRMTVTRTPWPPPLHHAREVLPTGFTITDAATVQRIATVLCALPALPRGVMSCPDLVGGAFRLFFVAPDKPIASVGVQESGCRVVSGLGPARSWAASATMQHEVSVGFGAPFHLIPPNA
jgi:hypothetical protein